ncbi:hypothetical protein Moror_11592 [Moniliophthora roreri MCA 2997]|uniref:Uncharacterized protein n=1 Tax=Moniliophthora roreri (strain MCA 2997) TaxID=1381753 RepID=V2X0Z1_MONRO|nr:hypothetical protein Moror_11592 [Moniliophthora roreri MCA 2997]
MPFIQECSDFDIRDNQITVVEGSQYNTTYDNRTFQIVRRETRELAIWDEFERVRIGNINLIKAVATSDEYEYDGPWWSHNRNRRTVARRTISVARIRGEDKEAEFLYVGYSGPEARQAFKRDFDQFSAVKHLNVAQLFGYSDSQYSLPALIFYDALIPLNRVLLANQSNWPGWQNRANCWIDLYFCFQVTVAGIDGGFFGTDPNILWIEPRSGALRRGPYVQSNAFTLELLPHAPATTHLNPLSIQTYSDTNTIFDYLTRIFPIGTIFKQVSDQDYRWGLPWPYLVSSLWKRGQQHIIARWMGFTQIPQYVCVKAHDVPHSRSYGVVMEDGSVRFRFADSTKLEDSLRLKYELFHGSEQLDTESAWLAQAHSIFSQLGIHEDEREEYSITTGFCLSLWYTEAHTYREKNTNIALYKPALYLFVRPIPRLSDDETAWRSWADNTYFWSLVPSGHEEMSESTRVSLGLKSYKTEIHIRRGSWSFETYRVLERFQHFKRFDPKTTDYAHSLGYPLMQVVGHEHRFQELNDDYSMSEDEESMAVDHDPPCDNPSHDIIPPPMPNNTSVNGMLDTETDEVTVGNKQKSKVAGSSSKRRKVHTDNGEDEDATTGSTIKCHRTAAAYAKNPVQVPKRGRWDNLPQRESSSRKVRPSVRAQEAREVKSEGSTSKKRGQGGRNGQGRASGKAR